MPFTVERAEDKHGICVNDMANGDVGVIVKWGSDWYIGRTVVRTGRSIQELGATTYWDDLMGSRREDLRVELLKPGDVIRCTE